MSPKQPDANTSLLRAKRLFMMNLALFALLLSGVWLLFDSGGDEKAPQQTPAMEPSPEKPLSLPEQAYMRGQTDALRVRPETMPPFEDAWVRLTCRKAILRDPAFAGQNASIELLVDAYYRGYSERFDDYFDSSIARKLGFNYGLRFDPALHPFPDFKWIQMTLLPHKPKLSARFGLDALKWKLFVKAFDQGFEEGYYRTKEGITSGAQAPILFDIDDF